MPPSPTPDKAEHGRPADTKRTNERSIFSSTGSTDTSQPHTAPIGKNLCGFKSAMCMIANGTWKETLVVGNEPKLSNLIEVLKGLPASPATIKSAIEEIIQYDDQKYLETFGSEQDPFVVLQCIQSALMESRKDARPEPLMPIWGCDCNSDEALLVCGNLEYRATSPHTYEMVKPLCKGCGRSEKVEETYLPKEFFVRVANCVQEFGAVNVIKEPYFKNYYLTGVVQFNPKLNHFRYFKTEFGRSTIIECGTYNKSKSDKTKEELLN